MEGFDDFSKIRNFNRLDFFISAISLNFTILIMKKQFFKKPVKLIKNSIKSKFRIFMNRVMLLVTKNNKFKINTKNVFFSVNRKKLKQGPGQQLGRIG